MRRKHLPPQHKIAKKEGVKSNYCLKIEHLEKDCRKKSADARSTFVFTVESLDIWHFSAQRRLDQIQL